jgi:heavy metal efflux system protein
MAEPSPANPAEPAGDFDRLLRGIIARSVQYRSGAVLIGVAIAFWGIWSAAHLSLDVTPDISNLQVQVLTRVPDLSPEEIESSVSRPLELEMFGLPGLEQVRSITRFGVSQVCLIFADGTDLYQARQMVTERLARAVDKLPRGLSPQLAPPSSGLGEVFTYALAFKTNNPQPQLTNWTLSGAALTTATVVNLSAGPSIVALPNAALVGLAGTNAMWSLDGLTPHWPGRMLLLSNASKFKATIKVESRAAARPADRIYARDGYDWTWRPGQTAYLWYDGAANRWKLYQSLEARLRQLKLIQEFVVKPCLKSVAGVAEVNTTGGYAQQMVVEVDPATLIPTNAPQLGMDLSDIAALVEKNAAIGGGALVERDAQQFIIRSRSRAQSLTEVNNICIKLTWALLGPPLSDLADVGVGSDLRLGAATLNGQEAVLGTAMMLTGENARAVARAFRQALAEAQSRLPADMELRPLYDRAELVDDVIGTVGRNLALAGGLVLAVLLLFLRSWRAALIVACLLVLSFALGLGGMTTFGIMGSLLTLGAIDFGVVVDDAIVMVENVARKLAALSGRDPAAARASRLATIVEACCQVRKPMLVGMLVIIGAYVPILTLSGVEGRMFRPLAQSLMLLLLSSLLLTLTLVPAFCAFGLGSGGALREPRFLERLRSAYERLFLACRRFRWPFLALALLLAGGAALLAPRLGANFLPYLDEGWLVVEMQRDPRISLAKSVELELESERALRAAVPEVKDLFSRIGMSEIATDPQGANQNDMYISFRPRAQWRRVQGRLISKAELGKIIKSVIERDVPGQELSLNQPIAVRFDELLEGVKTDVAIKLFGPDYDTLDALAAQVAHVLKDVLKQTSAEGEVVVDQPGRTDTFEFRPNPILVRKWLVIGDQVNGAVSIALAGRVVGRIDEGDIFYPLVVRCPERCRTNPAVLNSIPVRVGPGSMLMGLGGLGVWEKKQTVGTITREEAGRREAVLVTLESADVVGFVARARAAIQKQIKLPNGYRLDFSGAYKNWQSGSQRLAAAGGAGLLLSLALVYAALKNWRHTALVAFGLPFALVGGIYGLWLRGLPLTMPAAIGFVTLAGLSILNGMVLLTYFNDLRAQAVEPAQAALRSAKTRLRPVLMTALVASLGFVPMAISTSQGAELQRPFATVVIFGVLTSTALTLLIIPLLLAGKPGAASDSQV